MEPHMAMTEAQIKLASTHDWFVADNGDGSIKVEDRLVGEDGLVVSTTVDFHDYEHLLEWVGDA
jgi:hypothetical protein